MKPDRIRKSAKTSEQNLVVFTFSAKKTVNNLQPDNNSTATHGERDAFKAKYLSRAFLAMQVVRNLNYITFAFLISGAFLIFFQVFLILKQFYLISEREWTYLKTESAISSPDPILLFVLYGNGRKLILWRKNLPDKSPRTDISVKEREKSNAKRPK
ncbi:hypothetical protein AVEN_270185-1 [Araneus ventricosus]|uniref:Uncharacterized protein n=1 Tax=Araneus ventricosus TaxID=182803 RepID=A0A4Y2TRD5_ARAVE|nr:hypothetical protein AVEN_270185-1 [Araneus ventricosus]